MDGTSVECATGFGTFHADSRNFASDIAVAGPIIEQILLDEDI
jgi:hypothetical protein